MGRRKKARGRTRVYVVQDKSGSMDTRREATISGFNEYVQGLKAEGGDVLLSLVQFDTSVSTPFTSKPIAEVETMTASGFVPGGGTALRDGVGVAIRDAEVAAADSDRVLVVIMTDGGENSSREFTHQGILDRIADRKKAGWEFIFMGAGEEAWNAGMSLGIQDSHVINYGVMDSGDHQQVYAAAVTSTNNFLRGRDASFDAGVKCRLENKAKTERR